MSEDRKKASSGIDPNRVPTVRGWLWWTTPRGEWVLTPEAVRSKKKERGAER